MTQLITWRRTIVGGNASVNLTYQFNRIFKAITRIETYKDVRFSQVSSGGASLTFACVGYNIGTNVLMWTNGRTIYIPKTVNWGSWYAGMEGCAVHEIGHAFGSYNHGSDGIMRPAMYDPLGNFTPNDFGNWFRFPDRGGTRPWQEPDRWRVLTADGIDKRPTQLEGCECGDRISLWRKFMHLFESHEVSQVEGLQ